jgi:hypothetical protein
LHCAALQAIILWIMAIASMAGRSLGSRVLSVAGAFPRSFPAKLWPSEHVGAWRYMGSACGTRERWKTSRAPSAPFTRSLGGVEGRGARHAE